MSKMLESNTKGITLISFTCEFKKSDCVQVTTSKNGILQTLTLTREEAKTLAHDLYEFSCNREVYV